MTSTLVKAFAESDKPPEIAGRKERSMLDIGTRDGHPIYVDREVELIRMFDPALSRTVDVALDDPRIAGSVHAKVARGAIDMWKANRG